MPDARRMSALINGKTVHTTVRLPAELIEELQKAGKQLLHTDDFTVSLKNFAAYGVLVWQESQEHLEWKKQESIKNYSNLMALVEDMKYFKSMGTIPQEQLDTINKLTSAWENELREIEKIKDRDQPREAGSAPSDNPKAFQDLKALQEATALELQSYKNRLATLQKRLKDLTSELKNEKHQRHGS